jgi:murein DD-endopeptidase MepM/ murein hydrolase activator NlpD
MALLQAPVNSNVRVASSEVHVEDSALVADTMIESGDTFIQQNNEITTYKVQAGDTISSIAKKFGISSNTIIWANNLKRDVALKVGQNLVILPISGVQHKVASGDTLQAIAKKYKGDVDEIMAYNDINNNSHLKIGDIVVIPDGEVVVPTAKPKTTPSTTKKLASASVSLSLSEGETDTRGYYARPIKGGVRTQGIHGNNGVDLANSCGVGVYAAAAGEVIVSENDGGWNGGYGNYVVIKHSNGSQSLYAHMESTGVSVGSQVAKGQYIGSLGNSGKVYGATGCHVHFEIRNGISNPF